ncbi:transcriptional regulator ATRX-like isoform X1 [Photinus pyralis]|uniref:transcriptional regulator ATRX-like isoform X1 n=2 Tax=Photinus pyralis TaxID=7054 RepID=UPI0012672929|nr:transcriptional regulator ATRX-like isoform X1 [Photinus pyralis]
MNLNGTDDENDEWCYTCTVCRSQIGHEEILNNSMTSHPILRVLVCQKCHSHFIYDHKTKLDRTQNLCLWCFKTGDLKSCSLCTDKFCVKCLKHNLEPEEYNKLLSDSPWICVVCGPRSIHRLQAICKKVIGLSQRLNRTRYLQSNYQNETASQSKSRSNVDDITDDQLLKMKDNVIKLSNQFLKLFENAHEEVLKFKSKIEQLFTHNDFHKAPRFLQSLIETTKANLNLWEAEVNDWKSPLDTKDGILGKRKFNLSIKRLSDSDTNDEFSNKTVPEEKAGESISEQCSEPNPVCNNESSVPIEVIINKPSIFDLSEESVDSDCSVFSQATNIIAQICEAPAKDEEETINSANDDNATNISVESLESESSFVFDLQGYISNDMLSADDFLEGTEDDIKELSTVSFHIKDNLTDSILQAEHMDCDSATCPNDFEEQEDEVLHSHNDPDEEGKRCMDHDYAIPDATGCDDCEDKKTIEEFPLKSEFLNVLHLAPTSQTTPNKSENEEDENEEQQSNDECELWNVLLHVQDASPPLPDSSSSGESDADEFNDKYNLPKGVHGSISYELPPLPDSPAPESDINDHNDRLQQEIKPCYVLIEKLDVTETITHFERHSEGDNTAKVDSEIERLTNLDNIDRKRKHSLNHSKGKEKRRKTTDTDILSGSDFDSDSNSITPLIEEDILLNASHSDHDLDDIKNIDEDHPWNIVMNGALDDEMAGLPIDPPEDPSDPPKDSNDHPEDPNDPPEDHIAPEDPIDPPGPVKGEPRSASRSSNKENVNNEIKEETPAENDDWKSDRLLHFSLNDQSDKTSNKVRKASDDPKPKKARSKSKDLKSNENIIDSDDGSTISDSSDDDDFVEKYNKIIINSESDSDIEFVSVEKHKKRRSMTLNDIEMGVIKSDGKGRRNIRSILADETLSDSTKEANLAEKERKLRLSQKQKHMDLILSQSCPEQTEGLILDINEQTALPVVVVDPNLTGRLKPHQRDGVKFMWESCYESVKQIAAGDLGSGCILAHCMGLGKTFQVITLIHTLFAHPSTKTKHVLIICPLTVVSHWRKEFEEAFKYVRDKHLVSVYHTSDERDPVRKLSVISRWYRKGGAMLSGYESFNRLTQSISNNCKLLEALCDPGPDLVILDEGHLLKNGRGGRFAALKKVKTKRRIVLTGTPLQNNLLEYYYMIEVVKPSLLGSKSEYTNRFTNPITNGQYDDSTEADIIQMKKRSHVLHKLLKNTVQRFEASELLMHIPKRRDFAIFINLHDIQKKLYDFKVDMDTQNSNTVGVRDLIKNYHKFQNIWSHLYLFRLKQKQLLKEFEKNPLESRKGSSEIDPAYLSWWEQFAPPDSDSNVEYGPKFKVMLAIINECQRIGDKVLVFSNSLIELSAIQQFLEASATSSCQWKCNEDYFRMDGSTPLEQREMLCTTFNDKANTRGRVFLLTIKVGGLGLNLVGANRVILMDVNWNPAVDDQGVYRIYRFGQEKLCYVYRLVSMGTMEEVVYERQVTKLAISARVVDCLQISRHYKSTDLQQVYRSKFIYDQPRPILPPPDDNILANVYKSCLEVFKFHEHQSLLENLPEENLNEIEMKMAWDEFNAENERKEQQYKEQQMKIAAQQAATLNTPNRLQEILHQLQIPAKPFHPVINPASLVNGQSTKITVPSFETLVQSMQTNMSTTGNTSGTNLAESRPISSAIPIRTTVQPSLTTSTITNGPSLDPQKITLPPWLGPKLNVLPHHTATTSKISGTSVAGSQSINSGQLPVQTKVQPSVTTINSAIEFQKVTAPARQVQTPKSLKSTHANMLPSFTTPNENTRGKLGVGAITSRPMYSVVPQKQPPNPNVKPALNITTNNTSGKITATQPRNSPILSLPTNRQPLLNTPTNNTNGKFPTAQSRTNNYPVVAVPTVGQSSLNIPTTGTSTLSGPINSTILPVPTNIQPLLNTTINNTNMKSTLSSSSTTQSIPTNVQSSSNNTASGSPAVNSNVSEMHRYINDLLTFGQLAGRKRNPDTSNLPKGLHKGVKVVLPKKPRVITVTKPNAKVTETVTQLKPVQQIVVNNTSGRGRVQNSSSSSNTLPSTLTKVLPKKLVKNPIAGNVSRSAEGSPSSANNCLVQPTEASVIDLVNGDEEDLRNKERDDLLSSLNQNANITLSAIIAPTQKKGDVIEID